MRQRDRRDGRLDNGLSTNQCCDDDLLPLRILENCMLAMNYRRDVAYKLGENDIRHWLLLFLADRINVVEGIGQDLMNGHVPLPCPCGKPNSSDLSQALRWHARSKRRSGLDVS